MGGWSAVYRRFNLWSKKGLLNLLFNELAKLSDYDWVFADDSIVKAHQLNAGAATKGNGCIGKSRGGNSTKIHLAVDGSSCSISASGWLSNTRLFMTYSKTLRSTKYYVLSVMLPNS